jgi:ABC-type branched-subunit amino acid transport system permease subunit
MMLYTIGMVLAGIGAATLIGALTYVTLMLTGVILSMVTLTASPVLDKVFKEK